MRITRKAVELAVSSCVLLTIVIVCRISAEDCTCTKPLNVNKNCSEESEDLCEDINAGGFTCVNSTAWYFEDKGVVECYKPENVTKNDSCFDSQSIYIKCACNYRCKDPNPATGFCEKGSVVLVPHQETGNPIPQCSYSPKKISYPCTVDSEVDPCAEEEG